MGIYDTLNEQQQEAVFCTEGPLLLLAGAGSGKTRVLTHRIAYLMDQGVNPYHIMAITFTNKAAKEMRERVDDLVGFGAEHIWVSTFHSTCVRILRRHIDKLGYGNSFTIYDADDQKSLIKQICKQYKIDTKMMPERRIINEISSAKDEFMTPSEYETRHQYDFKKKKIAQIYKEYQKQLKANNALDFDDLIFKTVELFQFHPEVLDYYQERFRYIMVDEYQDTNTIQFQLVSMLARKYQNLCVVGDDDQSIYKFRGANVKNILNFENVFPEAVTIKLEQNYRSTKNILNAANEVIKHNKGRKTKKLWTENEEGDLIEFHQYGTEYEEARKIIHEIEDLSKEGYDYKNMAILYRTNAQSRVFEESFMIKNIPYRIVGGTNFYQRKEVKDILSYLKVVDNGLDDLAVRRIINVPRRGIGAATIEKINVYAVEHNISFLDACFSADSIDTLGNAKKKINGFADLIREFRRKMQEGSLEELFKYITDETGYIANLKAEETEEAEGRIENINELLNKVVTYEQEAEEASLSELLEEIALVADIDLPAPSACSPFPFAAPQQTRRTLPCQSHNFHSLHCFCHNFHNYYFPYLTSNMVIGDTKIIAEDLGIFVPEVKELLEETGYPGMKIIEFAFSGDRFNEHLPHMYSPNSVVYGGTHDNETLVGYFKPEARQWWELQYIADYMGVSHQHEVVDKVLKTAYASVASVVIFQAQDILKLDNWARMNTPGTVGNNWRWRMKPGELNQDHINHLSWLVDTFGRF